MVFGYRKEIWYLLDENKIHNFFLLRFFIHWYSSAVCAARFLWQTKWETNNEMRLRWRRERERKREMAAAVAAGYVRTSCNKENGVIGRKFTDFHFVLSPTLSVDVVYWVRCIWCNGWRRLVVCTHTHTALSKCLKRFSSVSRIQHPFTLHTTNAFIRKYSTKRPWCMLRALHTPLHSAREIITKFIFQWSTIISFLWAKHSTIPMESYSDSNSNSGARCEQSHSYYIQCESVT